MLSWTNVPGSTPAARAMDASNVRLKNPRWSRDGVGANTTTPGSTVCVTCTGGPSSAALLRVECLHITGGCATLDQWLLKISVTEEREDAPPPALPWSSSRWCG